MAISCFWTPGTVCALLLAASVRIEYSEITFAFDCAVFVSGWRHFEPTNAFAVTAFRLEIERLALFVEKAALVDRRFCVRVRRKGRDN